MFSGVLGPLRTDKSLDMNEGVQVIPASHAGSDGSNPIAPTTANKGKRETSANFHKDPAARMFPRIHRISQPMLDFSEFSASVRD